jgi:predicted transposase YdaD
MGIIHQPHDKFAKESLKQIHIMRDFLQHHLPTTIYQRLDMSTLQTTDKSYLNAHVEGLSSDIVYRCHISGQEGYIPVLLLVEHQSTPDEHMAFRLLQYTCHLMNDHLSAGNKSLPIVLPICLYHGADSPYPYSTDIYEAFEDPNLAKELMFKPFHNVDLTQLSLEDMKHHGYAGVMEGLLRNRGLYMLQQLADKGMLKLTVQAANTTYFSVLLNYVLDGSEDPNKPSVDDLIEVLNKALPDQRENIMTYAQQLEQRGMQRGMQQGIQQGRQAGIYQEKHEIARNMIRAGSDDQFIALVTGLSAEEIDALK